MVELSEPINVWVFFQKNLIQPYVFFWKNRRIKVEKINLIHTTKEGGNLFYHFSILAEGNFYRLGFDLKNLKWSLEAVEEGDMINE